MKLQKKREMEKISKSSTTNKYSSWRLSRQTVQVKQSQSQLEEKPRPSNKFHISIFTFPTIVLAAFLLFTLNFDPLFIESKTTGPYYSQNLHSYFETIDKFCSSRFIFYFALVFFAIVGCLLIFSTFISYQNKPERFDSNFRLQVKLYKIWSMIAISLFMASVLCLEIVTGQNSNIVNLTFVILANLFSSTCFSILFIPLVYLKRQRNSIV